MCVFSSPKLFASGWIWSRESRKEIEKEREAYQRTAAFQRSLKPGTTPHPRESRRAGTLVLELKRSRTEQLVTESSSSLRRKLVKRRNFLEQERAQALSGEEAALRSAYLRCLGQEEDWQRRARLLLSEFEAGVTERQSIYCSLVLPPQAARAREEPAGSSAGHPPGGCGPEMAAGLTDIFKHDTHWDVWDHQQAPKRGRLMWLYLRYWELIIELKKFKQVEKAILEK